MSPKPRQKMTEAGRILRDVPRPNVVERSMSKFLRNPPSVSSAAWVIVVATTAVVVASGFLMRLLDHKEYSSVFEGMWWAIQTVTTVGYGDVTPKAVSGRLVATFVMLEGIAFLAIVTAAITSTFVARAQRETLAAQGKSHSDEEQMIHDRLDDLATHLDRLETMITDLGKQQAGTQT